MDDKIFKKSIRIFNIEYKKIFGYIPCIENFSCNQDEYRNALMKAIQEKKNFRNILLLMKMK